MLSCPVPEPMGEPFQVIEWTLSGSAFAFSGCRRLFDVLRCKRTDFVSGVSDRRSIGHFTGLFKGLRRLRNLSEGLVCAQGFGCLSRRCSNRKCYSMVKIAMVTRDITVASPLP